MSKLQCLLLGIALCVIRIKGFSLTVTRGYQDSMYTDIRQTSTGLTCNAGVCDCIGSSTATYIFDRDSLTGKCVRDHEIIKDRSEGKLLPRNNQCVGVGNNNKVVRMSCNKDNLSVRWIWTLHSQMLNLKTLKCLKGENTTVTTKRGRLKIKPRLFMEKCNADNLKQKWECEGENSQYVNNKGTAGLARKWIIPGNISYFQSCSENIQSYKGCYRFSDGNFMKLIASFGCDTQHNGTCGLEIKIQAPIGTGYTSCRLDWTNSAYTISGYDWYGFHKALEGVELDTSLNPITLQIKKTSSLLGKWKGHLLKLNIQCKDGVGRSENHCALLKVEGKATEDIPVAVNPAITPTTSTITSPTTSSSSSMTSSAITSDHQVNMTSTSTLSEKPSSTGTSLPGINNENREANENSSIILPIVISAVVLFCLLLAVVVIVIVYKRRQKKKDTGDQNEDHIYEEAQPADNGPVSPIYMEIDNITRNRSKKSSRRRNKSQSNQDLADPTPYYHTLERPDGGEDNGIYEELDKVSKSPTTTPKAFEKELDV